MLALFQGSLDTLLKRPRFQPSLGQVAMLHYGRCGSSVLCDLLGQHPDIFWDAEVFERMFRKQLREARFIRDPMLLLRLRMALAGKRYYGFETKCHPAYHLSAPVLNTSSSSYIASLKQMGYGYFIILKRQNYLRQQVSEEVGRQKGGVWHQPAGAAALLQQVTIDIDCVRFGGYRVALLDSFIERDRRYAELASLLTAERTLWLTYEDHILPDPVKGYQQACEFVGITPREVTIECSRTNPFPLKDIIQNFAEVEAHLQNTDYEWMLHS
ncbi:hypothetical protein [cf. Phormidesmis sp. LEGE 11477]|uniref:hypothetical protein n=1 Tax=cf. Phormidesmis sp. LEGE 11477 TaxID=1828680 RepID=UPI00187FE023|nr:hypothetical protein [cf. Phormidesmis sp. LEGE 11477]MBE9062855.1 hypothetical protein [cf. Phormidesmis sp. LEGE 11477]